jgi:Uma2 family endonuclease
MSEKAAAQPDKIYAGEDSSRSERDNSNIFRHLDGKVLSTDSSNRTSNLIATNAIVAIGSRLQGQKSEMYVNDMCVKLCDKRYSFPNVIVVSGEPTFVDKKADILLSPTVVLEIFSKDTNSNDKTEKLECYLAMESIREYILVKEDEMRVDHYAKQNSKQWVYRIYNQRDDVISIEAINCKVSLAEIYAQIKFGQMETKSQAAA